MGLSACRDLSRNIAIQPPLNHFFLKFHFKLLSPISRGPGFGATYQNKILKKFKKSNNFLCLQAKKPKQRSRRVSRESSSHGDLSCSCVAAAGSTGETAWVFSGMWSTRAPGAMQETWEGGLWVMVMIEQRSLLDFHKWLHRVITRVSLYTFDS